MHYPLYCAELKKAGYKVVHIVPKAYNENSYIQTAKNGTNNSNSSEENHRKKQNKKWSGGNLWKELDEAFSEFFGS